MRERERTSVKRVQESFDWIERSRPRGESKASITDEKNGRKKERKKEGKHTLVGTYSNGSVIRRSCLLPSPVDRRKEGKIPNGRRA